MYEAEREHVVCRHAAWTEARYLKARRSGRSTRLDRAGRHHAWAVLSAFSRQFSDSGGEAEWLVELSREGPLLVLARTRKYRDGLAERLRDRGLEPFVLEGRGDVATEGVTLCTLHRSKGLEAPRVVIAGKQLVPMRWPGGDPGDKARWARQEQCLRARDWCGISSAQPGHSSQASLLMARGQTGDP